MHTWPPRTTTTIHGVLMKGLLPLKVAPGIFGRSWDFFLPFVMPLDAMERHLQRSVLIRGMAAVKEYHYEAAEKIDALADAAETKSLEQVAAKAAEAMSVGTLCFAAPCIIYEALKAAAAHGLDDKELQGIHVIANKMGVSKDKVDNI